MKMQCSLCNIALLLVTSSLLIIESGGRILSTNYIKLCDSSSCKKALQSSLPNFASGIPELGIPSLDPFVVDKLALRLPGGLKIEFRHGVSKGLRKCIVDSASLVDNTFHLEVHCNITIKGKYKSSGRLLMFAIDGDGDSMIKCKNLRIRGDFKLDTVMGADGQPHLQIVDYTTNHSYDGPVIYRLTNLIKGNPLISNVILNFMNKNWRMVAEEFGQPIIDYGVTTVLVNVKKYFERVPVNRTFNVL